VVRLSALRTGRLYAPINIPGTHFCYRLSQPQGHSAAGRIMSMKNSNDTPGNRTRELPTCSAVPQPTLPPRAPRFTRGQLISELFLYILPRNCALLMKSIYFALFYCVHFATCCGCNNPYLERQNHKKKQDAY
jgi:hypothetical protein